MKHTSPTLLVIAALAAAPGVHALSVKDDDVKLGIGLLIQARAELSDASTTAGVDYSPADGTALVDDVDFYLRRARLAFKGTWKDDYTFVLIMRGDDVGKTGAATANVAFYEGTIGRKFKGETLSHAIEFGYMAPTYNTSKNVHSSSSYLLVNEPSTALVVTNRNAGIKYHLSAPWLNLFVDVLNNSGDDAANAGEGATAADKSGEGLWTSARVHISPEGDWKIDKPQESWAGKEGKGVMVAVDVAQNDKDNTSATESTDVMGYGVDVVFHLDGLSALAEYRVADTETYTSAATTADFKSEAWRVQAGYAFPMGDTVLEPAVRVSSYDANDKVDSTAPFGTNDSGASGDQWEIGLNWYLHEHKNKLQLTYLSWEAEDGNADASIVRAQWQLSF